MNNLLKYLTGIHCGLMPMVAGVITLAGCALKADEEAARFAGNASHLQFIRARHEIEYSVARVFAQILAQRKLIESLQFNQKSLGSHLKIVNDLIAAQRAARIDRLRVEVRIADLQQSLTRAGNDMRVSMQVLANLMGLDKVEFKIAGKLTPPGKDASLLLASIKEQAMINRNDLAAMDERLKAQARQVDAAKAQTKPSVFIWAGYGGRWGADPDDDPAGADSADDIGRVGISIIYPLRHGRETAGQAGHTLRLQHSGCRDRRRYENRPAGDGPRPCHRHCAPLHPAYCHVQVLPAPIHHYGCHSSGRSRRFLGTAHLRQTHVQTGYDGTDSAWRHHCQQQHPAARLYHQRPPERNVKERCRRSLCPTAAATHSYDHRLHHRRSDALDI